MYVLSLLLCTALFYLTVGDLPVTLRLSLTGSLLALGYSLDGRPYVGYPPVVVVVVVYFLFTYSLCLCPGTRVPLK